MKALLQSTLKMIRKDIEYRAEIDEDIWQTYAESINQGGDCEDFCLSMREILLLKGVGDDYMSLVAGRLKRSGEMHMVLSVHAEWVIDPNERKVLEQHRYFSRRMNKQFVLSSEGLVVNGKFWMNREDHPKWQRYQEALGNE